MSSFEAYKQAINAELRAFVDTMPAALYMGPGELSEHAADVLEKLREYSLRPGKRIRGCLAAAAYDDVKGTHLAEAGIALGVAQELIQSYLLILDDVTDKSMLRRGGPTVHQEYFQTRDAFGGEHEANMLALYVSVIADQVANLALLQAPERPEHITAALHRLHVNLAITGFGQVDDVWHKIGRRVSQDDIVRMYGLKTGYYTFVNPLQTGLALAGRDDPEVARQIELFGRAAGVAFQMHDDYLGVFGESATTGKSNADDLEEGKYTLLVQYALEHGVPEDAKILVNILRSGRVSSEDVQRARRVFDRSGATLYVQKETREYAATAKKHLVATSVWSGGFKTFLSDLLDYSVMRAT